MIKKLYFPFYISVFGGVVVWFIIFFITPAKVSYGVNIESIVYILLCYLFLVLGYITLPLVAKTKFISINNKFINYVLMFVILSYIVRYIDIFIYRGLNFSNTISQNRLLASKGVFSVFFIIASVLKTLYFLPFLFLLLNKKYSKIQLLLSILLFIFPLIEAVLRGSRSPFVQTVFIFIFILLYSRFVKFSFRFLFLFLVAIGFLFFISTQILIKREIQEGKSDYIHLTHNAIYNDFFSPKKSVIDYFNSNTSNTKKRLALSALQIGQYYTHGVFEFDYIVKYYKKNKLKVQFGKYTYYVILKFTNKYNISKFDLYKIHMFSPRGYTFISFFGGLYIDFKWFGLLFMYLLGLFQKYIYNKIRQNYFNFAPIFLFFLFTNFFMLTVNFFKGSGTYTLISCIIFVLVFDKKIKLKKINI